MEFHLNLSEAEFLQFYQGTTREVLVRTTDGRTLKFPAELLQQFITRDGIQGSFEIEYDAEFRFRSLEQLSG